MNIHELYEKEINDRNKLQYNHGGRGEFYGGNQIYTTGFNNKVVPFSGKGYKLTTDNNIKKNRNCFQRFKEWLKSII